MSPDVLSSSPAMHSDVADASTVMSIDDDDDEKNYVCFCALLSVIVICS